MNLNFDLDTGLKLLNGVRSRLISKGWSRCFIINRMQQQQDLLGAIEIVSYDLKTSFQETDAIEDLLRFCVDDPDNTFAAIPKDFYSISLMQWNTYKYRKFSDVLDLIDTAISIIVSEQTNSDFDKK